MVPVKSPYNMSTSTKTRKGTSCDTCKRRKVRCVSTNNGDGSCNTCTMAKLSCTYTGTFKVREPCSVDHRLVLVLTFNVQP
ncbi:uncharacterized protein C8R40DRAFT_1117390 [Lentinula edodes]|uniref:uncharacterized protein n=1 Tax=Lentinula edodes TaxID=5353 RepID=UPI001E8E142A|nr:uncharacterized protein C8R40DRAFT_1117390 [Lentinula edodes]KAH7872248.1 hypothetical protein C8R40DRAFT_1117390 [Lentinula edodes]